MSNKLEATYGPGRTTPPLEARVAAVLAGHQYDPDGCVCTCSDEVQVGLRCDSQTHSQHVATMLAPVFADVWDEGAFDASMSLDHGGHNADNPYRSTP